MPNVIPFLDNSRDVKPSAAIFLSGGGSNAEKILEACSTAGEKAPFKVVVLVTDRPGSSRADEIGRSYGIPVVALDIRAFYRERGQSRVSIATPEGRAVREAWTDELRSALREHAPDFGILAGFVPLTNITGDFPCLNVHPGDLTYEKDGRRYLIGLHTMPVERAILDHLPAMRSSVIIAVPYTGGGDDMDSGPILGVSGPVPIDLRGETVDSLRAIARERPAKRPVGGYKDRLEAVAEVNLERLKIGGDWEVFPKVVFDFARGLFGHADGGDDLFFRMSGKWMPVETVVYSAAGREILFRDVS
ncbi:MAG: hypothetical protein RRC34_13570 [Lentisphaeria bacterium]|nr:hypothetical protein [Lentisphaeria bacterium]